MSERLSAASGTYPAFKSEEARARYMAAYDAAVREWPVPFDELEIPTRLGLTHVIASGPPDGAPLLLLPSLAATATVWRPNIAGLSRYYRTCAVDVIGQPGKSVANGPIRNRQEYAGWVVDVLDGLKIARTSIVGCSFGGFLAVNQVLLTPERIARVVLISPAGTFVGLSWRFHYVMRIRGPLLKLARRLSGTSKAPSLADLDPRLVPRDRRWSALMAVTMAERPTVSVIPPAVFTKAELQTIKTPMLLLIGDRERLYDPVSTLALASQRIPGLEGAVVRNADHIAAMAQPDEVNGRILEFLREGL